MSRSRRETREAVPDDVRERVERLSRVDEIAGHRIVRRLRAGTRATLLLARGTTSVDGSTPPLVTLKIFHADVDAASIEVELAALCVPRHAHVVGLVDVASIVPDEPPALVLHRLSGPTLAGRLEERPELTTGQAVTVIAPLCAALQHLHEHGVTHGGIIARRVVFDGRGAPVLTGFGRGMRRPTTAPPGPLISVDDEETRRLEASRWREAVLADQRQLLELARSVLVLTVDATAETVAPLSTLEESIGSGPAAAFLPEMEASLFRLSRPSAVALPPARRALEPSSGASEPGSATTVATPPAPEFDWSIAPVSRSAEPTEIRVITALRVLGVPPGVLQAVDRASEAVVGRLHRGPSAASASVEPEPGRERPIRFVRPLVVAVASASVLACTLLLTLPSNGDGAARARGQGAGPPAAAESGVDEIPDLTAEQAAAIASDDPVDALVALADHREACLDAASLACLAELYQPDSPALRTDEWTVQSAEGSSPVPRHRIDSSAAALIERVGGSAIVSARLNDQPASFLLVKGEAGWRLREFFGRGG